MSIISEFKISFMKANKHDIYLEKESRSTSFLACDFVTCVTLGPCDICDKVFHLIFDRFHFCDFWHL